jgi:hypothetical protein
MAAYYKVDVSLSTNSVTVGMPSPQEVIVTLPLVGPAGAVGATGAAGANGQGVPVGGSALQVLRKVSSTDYDTEWATGGGDVDLSSPDPIGDVTPNTGAFTTLSATGTATLPHIHGSLAGNLYIHVKNTSGGQLTRGTPVYIVGNVGDTDRVEVAAADFDDVTKMPAVGLLEQTLANNGSGDAIILGELDEANTNAYTINTELFVGNNGALTSTRPTTGQVQSVGVVARVNSNTGVIVVNMQGQRSPNETFAAASHTHGNITNAGLVGTTSGLPLKTGTGGIVEAGAFGTSAGSFCEGNDARLSDDRDPNLHAVSHLPDGADELFDQSLNTADTPTFAQITINDTENDQSVLTLSSDVGSNKIEFEAQELTLRHTGENSTPYINVTDGTDYALLGVREGEMFLQGSNAVVRIEKGGGGLADIKVNKLVLEDATTAGDPTATFDADGNLTANRTYDLPDASGTLALTSNIPASVIPATIVDAKGDLIVASAADTVARLAVGGTNGHVLTVDSAETLGLKYAALPAGGTKTYAVFTAEHNQPPASAFATLDTRNSIAVLDFDDASTESAVFVGVIPEAASLGSGLIVSLRWMATTATSGDVRWSVAWEKSNTDLDSDSFDTATAATATTNGTSGIVTVTNITCTTIDSLAAGDLFRLRVQRIGGDAADTMASSDAELVAVEVRSAA